MLLPCAKSVHEKMGVLELLSLLVCRNGYSFKSVCASFRITRNGKFFVFSIYVIYDFYMQNVSLNGRVYSTDCRLPDNNGLYKMRTETVVFKSKFLDHCLKS